MPEGRRVAPVVGEGGGGDSRLEAALVGDSSGIGRGSTPAAPALKRGKHTRTVRWPWHEFNAHSRVALA